MGKSGRRAPDLDTPPFSSPAQSSFPEAEPESGRDESARDVYRVMEAEVGASHELSSSWPSQDQPAREGHMRRSAACDGPGRKGLPEHRARRPMHASDPTPCNGESVSDGSEFEDVGRYLLAEELEERREEIVDTINSLLWLIENEEDLQRISIEELVAQTEKLHQTAQLAAMASPQEVETRREEVMVID